MFRRPTSLQIWSLRIWRWVGARLCRAVLHSAGGHHPRGGRVRPGGAGQGESDLQSLPPFLICSLLLFGMKWYKCLLVWRSKVLSELPNSPQGMFAASGYEQIQNKQRRSKNAAFDEKFCTITTFILLNSLATALSLLCATPKKTYRHSLLTAVSAPAWPHFCPEVPEEAAHRGVPAAGARVQRAQHHARLQEHLHI